MFDHSVGLALKRLKRSMKDQIVLVQFFYEKKKQTKLDVAVAKFATQKKANQFYHSQSSNSESV